MALALASYRDGLSMSGLPASDYFSGFAQVFEQMFPDVRGMAVHPPVGWTGYCQEPDPELHPAGDFCIDGDSPWECADHGGTAVWMKMEDTGCPFEPCEWEGTCE